MKRICLISYHFSETTIPLARYLARIGNSVHVYYIKDYSSSMEPPGLDLTGNILFPGLNRIPHHKAKPLLQYFCGLDIAFNVFMLPPLAKKMPWLPKLALRGFASYLRLLKFDVYHVIGHDPLLISVLASLPQDKSVVTSHEVCDHSASVPVLYPFIKFSLGRDVRVIVHSRFVSSLIQHQREGKGRVWIIPFGPFETYGYWAEDVKAKEDGTAPILFFGHLLPYKGLDVLAEALHLLKSRGAEIPCVIAGSGPSALLSTFSDLSNVKVIHKRLTNFELVEQLQQCHAVACPYKSASQSGVVMTAFQFGRPVIASDIAGLSEAIEHGKTGLLAEPSSSESLAAAIESLYRNPALYVSLLDNAGTVAAASSSTWEKIAASTILVYDAKEQVQ